MNNLQSIQNLEFKKNFDYSFELKCYSLSFVGKNDFSKGDKIILPPSILENLSSFEVQWPLMFEIENKNIHRKTHCGVLEFIADEGCAYLPHWMMHNISVLEGEKILFRYVFLEKGNYVKIQPQTSDFLEISNTKAILESKLRNFTCLTKSDSIAIEFNEKIYWLNIIEVKPGNAISIVETDINLDFILPTVFKNSNSFTQNKETIFSSNQKKNSLKPTKKLNFEDSSTENI
jgi:ubiquitin fusion degradation protein 1